MKKIKSMLFGDSMEQMQRDLAWSFKKSKNWFLRQYFMIGLMAVLSIGMIVRTKNIVIGLIPIILCLILITVQKYQIKTKHRLLMEQRSFEFLYFFSLLYPHLKQAKNTNGGLYLVLKKMESRLKDKSDEKTGLKNGVNRLILGMVEHPTSVEPFVAFAKECAGTELAEDVAISLYDWQNNADDDSSMLRLRTKVNIALHERMREIVQIKKDRFFWYSQKLVMVMFVFFIAILGNWIITMILDAIKQINLG